MAKIERFDSFSIALRSEIDINGLDIKGLFRRFINNIYALIFADYTSSQKLTVMQ